MKTFSTTWKNSRKQGKQRKYRANAQSHIKHKFVNAILSKDLRKKYGKRNIGLRKGDKIKVLRGEFRKYEGKVEKVDLKRSRIFVNGLESTKKDGTKKMIALHPSNLMITELTLDDKMRSDILQRK